MVYTEDLDEQELLIKRSGQEHIDHLGLILADPVYIVLVPHVPLLLGQDDEAAGHPGGQAPGLCNNDMVYIFFTGRISLSCESDLCQSAVSRLFGTGLLTTLTGGI